MCFLGFSRLCSALAVALAFGLGSAASAEPSPGPALGWEFFRPPAEPPGPSSRRAGVVISEIMYHPAARGDGLNEQFIEVFNSLPWLQDMGGWRISGDADFTFPTNFTLPARGYAIVAANPEEFVRLTGLSNVFGPFTGSLPNSGGTVRLRHRSGAVQFEVEYRDDGPWPAAADGAGPSLVLARPSYGERDPKAWAASEFVGGSPGQPEPEFGPHWRTIVINELLAHTDPPQTDYVELFNYSDSPVDLSGCVLTDDPDKAKFVLPANTVIEARGFLAFTEAQLGFALSAAGETVFLLTLDRSRVLDAMRFGAQENGVSWGRFPDGAPEFQRLATVTPGLANAAPRPPAVVINEIMYHPASDDSADEYVELHNPGAAPVDLAGWRLEDGVGYQFAPGTVLSPGGFLVVAKSAARLRSSYPQLSPANLVGDFSGTLGDGGERVALSFPDQITSTNSSGGVVTNTIHIVVDEVTYGTGGRWGRWSDGGGSSLELRDPRADRRRAPNWADSDETAKSPWVAVAATGIADNGNQTANGLELFLYGAGEALVDNVEVIGPGGTNLVANFDFENGTTNWVFQGNHGASSWETGEGFQSARSLHVRATGPGHTGPNRIRVPLRTAVGNGQTVTIRARARWLAGTGNIHFRLHGNWHEASGYLLAARDLGTPGRVNSRRSPGVGPAIRDVAHWPVLPSVSQPVRVTARVDDPDGLADLTLRWRRDPATNYTDVPMLNHGAGLYSATIPAAGSAALGAFYIAATDGSPVAATATFPADAPVRECLVRWGESLVAGALGNYRMWLTKTNVDRWTRREKLSNDPLDSTFVYGNFRAIYNAGSQYSGSPYHAPSYNGPTGNSCDYVCVLPADDALLGEQELNLLQPGNGGGDVTAQQEKHAYWIAEQLGLPFCHRRPVVVFVNGTRRGQVYDDAQQPTRDYVRQWFPDDGDGELRKIQLWFEFDNAGASFEAVGANLAVYNSGGGKKKARYRWNWPLRAFGNDPHNYTNLFRLVDAVNSPISGDTYTRTLLHATDVDRWFRTHVTEHLVGNNDSYSYGGGQNMYAYKPRNGPWELLIWDIDFAFASADARSDLFGIGGQNVGPVNSHAPFARLYWQALIDAANGPLLPERSNPIIDARYSGMRTNGAPNVGSGGSIRTYVAGRRAYINQLLTNRLARFAFTVNGGAPFDSANSLVTLTGTAPLAARTLTLNGAPFDVRWTTLTNWTATVALAAGTNRLVLGGLTSTGEAVTNAPAELAVNFTGLADLPEGNVIFNEVHHHPALPGSAFIELRNLSATTAFDLTGWRLAGVNFTFAPGTVLPPSAHALVVEDEYGFAEAFGTARKPLGVFDGKLAGAGETLRLLRPTADGTGERLVDQFSFETGAPWPGAALTGSSLQLIDPAQDNNRPANWTAAETNASSGPQWQRLVASGTATSSTLYIYLENVGEAYVDDLRLVAGNDPDVGASLLTNGDFETPLAGSWTVGANHAASAVSTAAFHSGKSSLRLVASSPGTTRESAIVQDIAPALVTDQPYTVSFWYRPVTVGGSLTVRLSGNGIRGTASLGSTPAVLSRVTPGTLNSVNATLPALPPIWLNELQTENLAGPLDNAGQREPWLELFNSGSSAVNLDGCFLGNSLADWTAWPFPPTASIPAGGTLLVWLDGQPGQTTAAQLHTGFRAAAESGVITLAQVAGGRTNLLDYLRYVSPGPDRSFGDFPDGDLSSRHLFALPTPRASNTLAAPAFSVFINEWMADNTVTLSDPADGGFKDWFELFNAGNSPANLAGLYLATSLDDRFQFRIPAGYVVPARGRLLVWADKKTQLNVPANADLHADFKLSADGEGIVLAAADGTVIDAVTFGPQQPDVSEGRAPDGGVVAGVLPSATPRTGNAVPAPTLTGVAADGALVTVSWSAFPGARYQLEATPGLEFPAWQWVGEPTIATGRTASASEPLAETAERFYRVRWLP